jgi:hypothetical protein
MNPNDYNPAEQADMPDVVRWQLRGLRRDVPPQRELWPGIAGRIAAESARSASAAVASPGARNSRRFAWLAVAASITLAIGVGWQLRPSAPAGSSSAGGAQSARGSGDPTATLMLREANAMTWEYKAALREIDVRDASPADAGALRQLDRSAALVRRALAQDPDAHFLLDRLQKLYARRLALTQRLALS